MVAQVVPVGLLTTYVRELLENDDVLSDIWVEGEVSNVFRAQSGHVYFTIKDMDAQLKCVLFKPHAVRQRALPEAGQHAAVHGAVSLYPRDGAIQLYTDVVQPAGIGLLALEFEQLRLRLEADGLFDPSRKRPLPERPRTIGVVTSPDGAVWHDIQNVLRRRYPIVEVILSPTKVQGDAAPDSIVNAFYELQDIDRVDVIILARGGGSAEDLAAFNDEDVARTVFASSVPVITGIGHDTDWTIVDWVADLRAPTPSAAAELCVPDVAEIQLHIAEARERMDATIQGELDRATHALAGTRHRLAQRSPMHQTSVARERLSSLTRRLHTRQRHSIAVLRESSRARSSLLKALEPEGVLRRGYAVVYDNLTGFPLNSTAGMRPGRDISVHLAHGDLTATVSMVRR